MKRWAGPLITSLILLGVVSILLLNLDLGHPRMPSGSGSGSLIPTATAPSSASTSTRPPKPAGFREYPIPEEVEKNGIRVAAVWLPPIEMEGQGHAGADIIHLEADVEATEGNPNGFGLGEFVPYLKIAYEIAPAAGGPAVQKGELLPMVASDGLHYGASVAMPKPGKFRLIYSIQPPSAGGLGRHSDPVTGVAPWWPPFQATFDWDYPGPPAAPK
jgi:periplasmic iron binding protein